MTSWSQSVLGNLLVAFKMAPAGENKDTDKLRLSQDDRAIRTFGMKCVTGTDTEN